MKNRILSFPPRVTKILLVVLGFIFVAAATDVTLDEIPKISIRDLMKAEVDRLKQEIMEMVDSHLKEAVITTMVELGDDSQKKSTVPIGFVYFQLPNQTSPQTMWPGVTWTDVTRDYAGLFFRAEGGGSLPFGTTQDDNTRQISMVSFDSGNSYGSSAILPASGWSPFVQTGFNDFSSGSRSSPMNTGQP